MNKKTDVITTISARIYHPERDEWEDLGVLYTNSNWFTKLKGWWRRVRRIYLSR